MKERALRETAVFGAFIALSVAMTWPWAAHLRDAVPDAGDPYFMAWVLWNDFFKTFHAPLHLFDGNIFYPLKDTLAFSEHSYGVALPFFPLFALGVRPLTVVSVATLLSFAFSGYGAFRLARTLTGSSAAGWIAGIAFAFTPYRFYQLPHLVYIFAGWIPLLFEALVLFARSRSWKRAAWLGVCFFFNGLTAIHWLVLTALPFACFALFLVLRERAGRDPRLARSAVTLAVAGLALLPFLVPYQRAAKEHGFTRGRGETLTYSAEPRDWLRIDYHNRFWYGLGAPAPGERALFPGALMPALAAVALVVPWWRRRGRADAIVLGLTLAALGFAGSLGLRFAFHRLLYEWLSPFRSIRVPARWAMVAHLGLALLAALGVLWLVERLPRRAARACTLVAALAFLWELREAPLGIVHGAVDPDELTKVLTTTPMRGGLVELPSTFGQRGNYEYVLRAADHRKPLINAVSGFAPPHVLRLEALAQEHPIPEALLDHLESIPTSYLVVHESFLDPWERPPLHRFLSSALAAGRLRFLGRFDGVRKNDLYVVTKTEPGVAGSAVPPWEEAPGPEVSRPKRREDGTLLGSVDEPAGSAVIRGQLLVRGWARAPGEDLGVTITIDGEARSPVAMGRAVRKDVCVVFPNLAPCETAGWEARFDFQRGDEGDHEIVVLFEAKDGRARHYPVRRFAWTK